MTNIARTFIVAGILAAGLQAQSPPAAPPAFDMVTIRLHPEPVNGSGGGRSNANAMWNGRTLFELVVEAYGMKAYQVSGGPYWVGSDHFDISAMAPSDAPATNDRFIQMFQAMLADRFQLKVHRETKELPVLALTVDKTGPKLKAPDTNSRGNSGRVGPTGIQIKQSAGTMQQLVGQLQRFADLRSHNLGLPVLDKTGLTGKYAYELNVDTSNNSGPADSLIASVSTALQEQLGLRLEPQQVPIETLVIDSAEKPSVN